MQHHTDTVIMLLGPGHAYCWLDISACLQLAQRSKHTTLRFMQVFKKKQKQKPKTSNKKAME